MSNNNCFVRPFLQQPVYFGREVVLHNYFEGMGKIYQNINQSTDGFRLKIGGMDIFYLHYMLHYCTNDNLIHPQIRGDLCTKLILFPSDRI